MKLRLGFIFVLCFGPIANAQSGCTDPLATNFDPIALTNDGSCTYPAASISPSTSTQLNPTLNETSGLILWDNDLWTHNDSGNTTDIYAIGVDDLTTFSALNIPGVTNVDWEDMAEDDTYIYIGDFGNNANGNRTDLKIYRIAKASLGLGTPVVDEINFSYEDQTDFSSQPGNTTNFDCEALIITDSGIFLFTKEWSAQQTTVYTMPKTPGNYSAINQGSYNVNGLITGATYFDDNPLVVLSGYTLEVLSVVPLVVAPNSFLYLLYDFQGSDFFTGNKRKIDFAGQDQLQIEGISSDDGINYYLSNEKYDQFNVLTNAQIHEIDLSVFVSNYLSQNTVSPKKYIKAFPNPLKDDHVLSLSIPNEIVGNPAKIELYNTFGKRILDKNYKSLKSHEQVEISTLSSGLYILKITVQGESHAIKLINY